MPSLLALLLTLSSANLLAAEALYPLPKSAYGLKHIAEPYSIQQDSFTIKLPYPSRAVVGHYRSVLPGWRECRARQGWSSFADPANGKREYVHQLMHAWVKPDNKTLVVLGLRYVSPGIEPRSKPDTEEQQVILMLNQNLADAVAEAKNMDMECTPNSSLMPTPESFVLFHAAAAARAS